MPELVTKSALSKVSLAECCEEIGQRVENPAESGYERFVGLEHLETGETSIRNWGSTEDVTSSMKLFKEGDVIVARRNVYLRRAARADFDGVCSGDGIVLRGNLEVCLPELLPFLLNTDEFWNYVTSQADGTMSKRITVKRLMAYELALPPLEEQRRIVEVLQAASASSNQMARLSQRSLEVESAYVKAQIPAIIRENGRVSLPPDFIDSGWTTHRVDQLGRVLRGSSPRPKSDPRYYGGSIPRLTVKDINRDGMYVTAKVDSLTKEGAMLSRPVPKRTLVMVCSGNIGEPSILAEDACIHDGILAVTELCNRVSAEYLYYAFRTLRREFLRLTTNGGIWSNLTTDVLKSIEVPVPPIDRLSNIVDRIMQFSSTIEAVKQRENANKELAQRLVNSLLGQGGHR